VAWKAPSLHNSSTKGAYSRAAAGIMDSKLPDAITWRSQSEKAFSFGPIE